MRPEKRSCGSDDAGLFRSASEGPAADSSGGEGLRRGILREDSHRGYVCCTAGSDNRSVPDSCRDRCPVSGLRADQGVDSRFVRRPAPCLRPASAVVADPAAVDIDLHRRGAVVRRGGEVAEGDVGVDRSCLLYTMAPRLYPIVRFRCFGAPPHISALAAGDSQ